jgi:6-phosphogluconolactonase
MVYVGTYTGKESKGIYIFEFDAANGKLKQTGITEGIDNPSYLAVSRDNKYLYSVIENETFGRKYGGGVAAFSIDKHTGGLTLLNTQSTLGKHPCHLSMDSSNRFLIAANYTEGTFTEFSLNTDGRIESLSTIVVHDGSGMNAQRQEKAHVHYVTFTPEEQYLCAVDLGIDRVKIYDFNHKNGNIFPVEDLTIKIKPGSGPRHIIFHPYDEYAYVINELSSEIAVLKYTRNSFKFDVVQYISTLPEEYKGENYGAAIHISACGRYVYASNRGHDSIAIFKIDRNTGKLTLISHAFTMGGWPRDFEIDPTGEFLFAANQNSNTIVSFRIDPESGELNPLGVSASIPNPVCIKFIKMIEQQ